MVSPAMTTESLLFLMVDVGRLFVFWVVVVVVVVVVLVLVLAGGVARGGSDVDVDVVFITGHPRILDWGIEVWRVLGFLLGSPVLERCQVKGVPPVLTRLNWIMIVRR